MQYSHHPLPHDYSNIVGKRDNFTLVIVDKDPFPSSPTGIPFCKGSWEEQLKANNSGLYVLKSIGIDVQNAETSYPDPSSLFHDLVSQGIVFLNCSYHFLDTTGLPKKDHTYVDQALPINEPIIRKATNVLLCGEAKILEEKIKNVNFFKIVHPDIQNRSLRASDWNKWWADNSIKQYFNLS
ncbi:hypothetical protein [Methylovulum sp.]|uniref:hypothetical protein n=1 Tax=Methylovulum sp. TaxID=1916980 RepID=UPI00263696BC|nr:hypothetical protein [Methylovulum sp.]MDD5125016.1 hypothetical protein [Methylovulum sp.]